MQNQQQNAETPPVREVVFDESGQTVEVHAEPDLIASAAQESAAGGEVDPPPEGTPKIRIGDQEFASQEAALDYAQRLQAETDAYQRGVNEAMQFQRPQGTGVTPQEAPPIVENVEELYTNPQEFLKKYATKIKTELTGELSQRESMKAQSDQIWREFTDRHPSLADFRTEVENFVAAENGQVRAMIQAKGRPASYDFIATKLKSRFEAYASALKPKRELPNTGGGPSPTQKTGSVTPKETPKKVSTMAEQMRSMRKSR
jgi:hypothetical protein